MLKSVLVLSLCAAGTVFACTSDLQCNLNGLCVDGSCKCDPAWTGTNCSYMAFVPNAVPYMDSGYGQSTTTNISTWGGNAVLGDDGLYHLFVARMVEGCALNTWGHNSRVEHAVSKTPIGPYEFHDVAVWTWSHNPEVVQYKDEATGATKYALFHIGDGGNSTNPTNCTASMSDVLDVELTSPAAGSTLHLADSPYGPWVPSSSPPPNCNNPAPMYSNGTWWLVCGSDGVLRSSSVEGPWTKVATTPRRGIHGSGIHYEDAFLFVDARGSFHTLYHVYNITSPCGDCLGTIVSAHDFSPDGTTWYSQPGQPFDNTYTTTSGKTVTISTRERPKLMFNSAGQPTHLFNGVSDVPSCAPTQGVQCKVTNPGWWTYTLVVPIQTA